MKMEEPEFKWGCCSLNEAFRVKMGLLWLQWGCAVEMGLRLCNVGLPMSGMFYENGGTRVEMELLHSKWGFQG